MSLSSLLNSSLRLMAMKNRGIPMLINKRHTTDDYPRRFIGKREIVGYGWNGSPVYHDCVDFPFPAIRFQEPTPEICALREKEEDDWKKLTIDEKKQLYRYSFCQTFSEMKAGTPEWKLYIAMGIFSISIGIVITIAYFQFLYGPYPETFEPERRKAQLKRIIALEMNPIQGIASRWDYENNTWKD